MFANQGYGVWPRGIEEIRDSKGEVLYRRAGDGPARAFPRLSVEGLFRLVDEAGQVAFSGTAATLADRGLAVDLPKWRTAIYRIEKN